MRMSWSLVPWFQRATEAGKCVAVPESIHATPWEASEGSCKGEIRVAVETEGSRRCPNHETHAEDSWLPRVKLAWEAMGIQAAEYELRLRICKLFGAQMILLLDQLPDMEVQALVFAQLGFGLTLVSSFLALPSFPPVGMGIFTLPQCAGHT